MDFQIDGVATIVSHEGECEYCRLISDLEPAKLKSKSLIDRMRGKSDYYIACYDCRTHFGIIKPEQDLGEADVGHGC